jgi:O-antigen/teichoic acid export membrane protein
MVLRPFIARLRRDSNLVELLRNSGLLYVSGVFSIGLTFVQQITTANRLGPADYGRFAVVLGSSTLLLLILDVRTWELGTKLLVRPVLEKTHDETVQIMSWLLLIDVVVGVLGVLLVILLAGPIAEYLLKAPDLDWLVRVYGLSLIFRSLGAGGAVALVRLYDRFDWLSIKSVGYALARLILISGAAFLGFGILGVVVGAVLSEIVNALAMIGMTYALWRRHMPAAPLIDLRKPQCFREGRRLMIDLWVSATLKGLQLETLIPLTALFTLPAQVGLLRTGMDITDLITKLTAPLSIVLSPAIIKAFEQGGRAALLRLIKQSTLLLAILSVPLSVGIIVGGPFLFPRLLQSGYEGVSSVASLLAVGFGINAVFLWLRPAVIALGIVREQNIVAVAGALFSTVGLIALTPAHGAMGSALTVSVMLAGSVFVLAVILLNRLLKLSAP